MQTGEPVAASRQVGEDRQGEQKMRTWKARQNEPQRAELRLTDGNGKSSRRHRHLQ